jgi:hypothetical protein
MVRMMASLSRYSVRRSLLALAVAGVMLGVAAETLAQSIVLPGNVPPRLKKRNFPDELPAAPSLSPAFSIPIQPLGYGPPGPAYLGRHETLVSLDFLDENRVLFSFPAQGLLHREADSSQPAETRQIQAFVLALPNGKIESQALWTLPDSRRYLWMLKDGRFLLRNGDGFRIGNDKLDTKPFLKLPGELISLQIAPTQSFAVVNSIEQSHEATSGNPTGSSHQPAAMQTTSASSDVVVRTVDLASGQVTTTQHVRAANQLPINAQGHLNIAHEKFDQWSLRLNAFQGGSRTRGHVQSNCRPTWSFLADEEILVAGCDQVRRWKLDAVNTNGQQLWETQIPTPIAQPLLVTAPNGLWFARETLVLNEGVKPGPQTLWVKAIKGQAVRVYDSSNGKVVLESPVNPVLDAGGNLAFSPSGRRIAILNADAIQIFDLPAANR